MSQEQDPALSVRVPVTSPVKVTARSPRGLSTALAVTDVALMTVSEPEENISST